MSLIATEVCIWKKDFVVCRGERNHHVWQGVFLWNNEFETLLPLLPTTHREKESSVYSRLHRWIRKNVRPMLKPWNFVNGTCSIKWFKNCSNISFRLGDTTI